MSLAIVFNQIKTLLAANIGTVFTPFNPAINTGNVNALIPYVQMFNGQVKRWKANYNKGTKDDPTIYGVLYPCVLVEFEDLKVERLGDNSQIYPHLIIRIHLVDMQLDAGDGTMEQNLQIFAEADALQLILENWKPDQCGELVRMKSKLDYDHSNLYHMTIDYVTTFIDNITSAPIGGVTVDGVEPDIELSYDPAPFLKPL